MANSKKSTTKLYVVKKNKKALTHVFIAMGPVPLTLLLHAIDKANFIFKNKDHYCNMIPLTSTVQFQNLFWFD